MNDFRKDSPEQLDAMLRAIGRASRDCAPAPGDAAGADDEALIARLTERVLAEQGRAPQAPTRPRASRPAWLGAALAASLALAFYFVPPRGGVPAVPAYAAEVSGLDRAYRDAAPSTDTRGAITVGNRLVVVLRPPVSTSVPVTARLWRDDGHELDAIDVPLTPSAAGAWRLDAVVGAQLPLDPGEHRLWLVVTTRDLAPSLTELRAIDAPRREADRYVLPLDLLVRAP